jgi:hypothetical protein
MVKIYLRWEWEFENETQKNFTIWLRNPKKNKPRNREREIR